MKIIKKIMREVKVIDDIICDCCGKSTRVAEADDEIDSSGEWMFNYIEFKDRFGYYSQKDNDEYMAHICEKCFDEKFHFINWQINKFDQTI